MARLEFIKYEFFEGSFATQSGLHWEAQCKEPIEKLPQIFWEDGRGCAGGDGDKPCRDAIFDREKRDSVERNLKQVEERILETETNSPRQRALHAEAQGLRNFLNVTQD
jgi:hypothetical protein